MRYRSLESVHVSKAEKTQNSWRLSCTVDEQHGYVDDHEAPLITQSPRYGVATSADDCYSG